MKFLALIVAILLPLSSMANEAQKLVCVSQDYKTEKLTNQILVMNPLGEPTELLDENGEYVAIQIPYVIRIYEGAAIYRSFSAKGIVTTEDVIFTFESEDGETVFNVYLDEMEESNLVMNKSSENPIMTAFVCH